MHHIPTTPTPQFTQQPTMANLTVLSLALASLLAFTTAHTTIVTTTIEDENPISEQRQCSQQLQGQRVNECDMYFMKGMTIDEGYSIPMRRPEEVIQQACCKELQNVDEKCQCEVVKQLFQAALQMVKQQQSVPILGSQRQKIQKLKQRAQILPNVCNFQSKRCEIGTITTTITESNMEREC
ncbi:putative bifunctional inhibitor/plant lipid transfer protein/seed storage helical [Helianthus anomalus]